MDSFHQHRARLACLLLVLLTYPAVVWGSILAIGTSGNDIMNWAAEGSPTREAFESFRSRFGENDALFVSWTGCGLGDPRLVALERELKSEDARETFKNVLSGPGAMELLVGELDIRPAEAAGRLQGVLLDSESGLSGISVSLTSTASQDRASALGQLYEAIDRVGIERAEVRIGGPAHDLYALDYEGLWSPLRAVPYIMLAAFLLTWFFVGRFGLAAVISVFSWYTGLVTLTMVYLSRVDLNAVVWTLPTLIMLLTVSASLHFLGYYRDALPVAGRAAAAQRAFGLGARPTIYCAVTTSAGLFSLLLSETEPVRQFGGFGGIAVLVSSGVVLGCLPAWLTLFPLPASFAERSPLLSQRGWAALGEFTQRRRWWIFAASLATVVSLGVWLPQLRTSVNIRHLFPPDSQVVRDTRWIETHVCKLSSVELVFVFPNPSQKNDLDRLRLLKLLDQRLRDHPLVYGTLSAATFAPELPHNAAGISGIIAKRVAAAKIQRLKQRLPEMGVLANGPHEEAWRFSVRVSHLAEFDYARLLEAVRSEAEAVFSPDGQPALDGESWQVVITGRVPVFNAVEGQFLDDLRTTYFTAFLVISVVVVLVMRSLVACLLATVPNVFPALTVLGGTALLGSPLDVASLMTASVALGIAVDDTLHFSLWWRNKVAAGLTSSEAIADAMQHCGVAMVQTSVVCGLSVALYGLCGFLPTVRFGLLLSAMMFAALVGDLFLLPALLGTRLARRIV